VSAQPQPPRRSSLRERQPRLTSEAVELAELLQQIDRTFVLHRGQKLSYFGGCDYFRLSSHPAVLDALRKGLDEFGLNVSASRRTTGNHSLYVRLEEALARFFQTESAVVVSSGYAGNLIAAQALAGEFTHALIDEHAHVGLRDALHFLGCRSIDFSHRNPASAAHAARRLGRNARILLLTDGLFSYSGEVAPLGEYLQKMPRGVTLFVDDAHGAGTLGKRGRGTAEFLGISTSRMVQTITLSKAFGVYGGAILGSRNLRDRIVLRSRYFIGNTPLPLPLAAASLKSLQLFRQELRLRRSLVINARYVKAALREAGVPINEGPGPIVPVTVRDPKQVRQLRRALFAARVYPSFIRYPGGSENGYFRFAISSEHSAEQLDALIAALVFVLRNG
jgi:7-keto-8-aminopelargonate synthetase-like enzyme